jgi:hypothetical protein
MAERNLTQAIEYFATTTCHLSEVDLERPWVWRAYDEGVRFAFFRTYEELRTLAAQLLAERTAKGPPITTAHHALAQYHAAYRDLQAFLIGQPDSLLDVPPAPAEWPLRIILGHVIAAEREFFARIWHAVQRYRDSAVKEQDQPEVVEMTPEEIADFVGSFDDFQRTMDRLSLAGILAYYDSLHKRILRELTGIRGFEMEAETLWWEGTPFTVEFRLHRLDSHLRQHIVQMEKTFEMLDHPQSEARRLLRLIYGALADVDGVIIGDWGLGRPQRRELAGKISQRVGEIREIFQNLS